MAQGWQQHHSPMLPLPAGSQPKKLGEKEILKADEKMTL